MYPDSEGSSTAYCGAYCKSRYSIVQSLTTGAEQAAPFVLIASCSDSHSDVSPPSSLLLDLDYNHIIQLECKFKYNLTLWWVNWPNSSPRSKSVKDMSAMSQCMGHGRHVQCPMYGLTAVIDPWRLSTCWLVWWAPAQPPFSLHQQSDWLCPEPDSDSLPPDGTP